MRKFSLKNFCLLVFIIAGHNKLLAGDLFNYHYQHFYQSPHAKKTGLLKLLKEIKTHYRVNFVYQKKFLSGKVVEQTISYNQSIDELLHLILTPLDLSFERTAPSTFVIFPASKNKISESDYKAIDATSKIEDQKEKKEPAVLPVSGIITDENNRPLPNVTILEKGISNGAFSNSKGEFIFYPRNAEADLSFSYIGYKTVEMKLSNLHNLSIQMLPDIKQNEEIIVIAYGSKPKRDLTGAISAINSKEIEKSIALSPQMAMQGRMAGVYVSSPGGDPNAEPVVRIRGVTTFSGKSSGPLYVVDGVVIDEYGSRSTFSLNAQKADDVKGTQNIFNLINPADIESISVLKDASSAAAYGARAANGVVLITTKKGSEGKPRVNFSANFGSSNLLKKLSVLNTEQYVEIINEANAGNPDFNDSKYDIYKKDKTAYLGNSGSFDWQSAIINKNALYRNYDLSISGGSKTATYYLGGGYAYQESSLKFNNQKRYSLSSRTEFKINKILELGQTLRLAYTDLTDNRDNTGSPLTLRSVMTTPPWQPIYGNGPNGFATVSVNQYGPETEQNFLGVASVTDKQVGTYKMLGNAYITLSPINNLHITAYVGADYFTQRQSQWFLKKLNDFVINANNSNSINERRSTNFLLQKRLSVNYTTSIAQKHFVDFYLHAENQKSIFNFIIAGRTNITDVDDPNLFTVTGQGSSADTYKDQNGFINYLGRISYKYLDKYYVDINYLHQGSSVFNPGPHQWGNFPSISAAWRITKENFLKNLQVSDLKLKFGMGELGNSDTKGWQYLTLINNTNAAYVVGGNAMVGAFFSNYPNVNLTWERLRTYNAGIEGALLNQKINFSFEYYKRITSKILQPYRLPASVGVIDLPFKNIGAAENNGVEISLAYLNHIGKINYSVGGNFTTTKNSVTKLNDNVPVVTPAGLVVLGDPINSLYGFKSDGVIKTQSELDQYQKNYGSSPLVQQLKLGDLKYRDIGGAPTATDLKSGMRYHHEPDGKIDDYDGLAYLGKTIPGFFYGINLGADYRKFDISVLLQGVGDVKKLSDLLQNGLAYRFSNKLSTVLNRWTASNSNSDIPRAINYGASSVNNARLSERFIEKASFLRLSNIQLGFSLSEATLKKLKYIEHCRIYMSASNVFLLTKYSGYDPENDSVPQPRTILVGINMAF